jgi:hypothetical protein
MRLLLSIACENGWGIDQLDVDQLYLNVAIKDEPSIWIQAPHDMIPFTDSSLTGHKPCVWLKRFMD